MTKRERTLETIRCCRVQACERCPMMEEICDELRVDMVDLPEELVDMIEEELENKIVVLRPEAAEEQKRKWLKNIADNQLAIGGADPLTEYEQGKWDGMQAAYEIVLGDE